MKIGSKHQSAEVRRQQIISAADLILIEAGTENFTIDQVAERAKIAKGTVYKYFQNKDELLAEIGIKSASLLLEAFQRSTEDHTNGVEQIRAICLASYQYHQTYPNYYELLSYIERPEFDININGYIKISQAIQRFCQDIIEEGQKRGEIRPDIDSNLAVRVLWASNMGVIQFAKTKQKLIEQMHSTTVEKMIDTFVAMVIHGIAGSEPAK